MSRGPYRLYQDRSQTLEGIGLWRNRQRTLTGENDPERVAVCEATGELFEILGARSFWRLRNVDPGVQSRDVLTFEVSLPGSRYEADEAVAQFQ
jgi:hypothetical protein